MTKFANKERWGEVTILPTNKTKSQNMNIIENPILKGFNPDPSIIKVGDDFYIATSTFEWYPGVQIHHSRDLINWQLITRPLNRPSQLNMLGNPDSCGVWAPCLSYDDGLFYLVYTDVKRFDGNFKDTHNYLVTSDSIDGDWSDPVYLNSSGFDPSLFHDEDGRKWLVNVVWDHRPDRTFFGGILLQEFSASQQRLIGPIQNIFNGSPLGCTEGPHLYKKNGYYYLITAEGGTGPEHAVTMARSKKIDGPYVLHPKFHVITSKDSPSATLRRAGHGDFVELEDDSVYLVHLCSRPLRNTGTSPLGRETSIQKAKWDSEGWLRLEHNGVEPQLKIPSIKSSELQNGRETDFEDFNHPYLPIDFQWLRSPWPQELFSLSERPGYLRLYGHESLGSWFKQALVARRQQAFRYSAETIIEFQPESFQQMAGLVCYYNTHKYHYLYISHDEKIGKHLGIMSCNADQSFKSDFPLQNNLISLPNNQAVYLKAEVEFESLYFFWALDGINWKKIEPKLNAGILSDEAGKGEGANFTGAFVGLCAQDLTGRKSHADFDYFVYSEKK